MITFIALHGGFTLVLFTPLLECGLDKLAQITRVVGVLGPPLLVVPVPALGLGVHLAEVARVLEYWPGT